jgi:hypothetical protein
MRFNRFRFHAKARSREVKTLVHFDLAVLMRFKASSLVYTLNRVARLIFAPLAMSVFEHILFKIKRITIET